MLQGVRKKFGCINPYYVLVFHTFQLLKPEALRENQISTLCFEKKKKKHTQLFPHVFSCSFLQDLPIRFAK